MITPSAESHSPVLQGLWAEESNSRWKLTSEGRNKSTRNGEYVGKYKKQTVLFFIFWLIFPKKIHV